MSREFQQLKKRWNLAADTSAEELLKVAQNKLKSDPDNPELVYTIAELLRHTGKQDEASKTYQQAIKLTDKRSNQRSEKLEQRLEKKRDHTRAKFLLLTSLPFIIILVIAGLLWKTLSPPEPIPADADPNQFAFTQWLAKQQMVEIMTTLQKQNPELTFDFSRPSAQALSPMEFMQSLMSPDALGKMRRDKQRAANNKAKGENGRPAFQCSKEPPIQCAAQDIPSAPGEKRREVVLLMEAYNAILDSQKDCEKLEESIQAIGEQLQWRASERRIKAELEHFAVECFYRAKNVEKTIEHARKLQCTDDKGFINSVYWYMTAITHQAGDIAQAETAYQCFQEATDYVEENDFSPAYTASRHRESGALAWLYFNDLSMATSELLKARKSLKSLPEKTQAMREVIAEINLDLMETYVTANIDSETFQDLMEEINSSGLLTDGYKQIKDTLATIYYMQNKQYKEALIPLSNMASRFKLMPEYICGWDWSGFKRGLDESIANNNIRKQAKEMVNISDCYVQQSIQERIRKIGKVSQWLRNR